jgi:4'-phosphopantetheinyl transferase EntD
MLITGNDTQSLSRGRILLRREKEVFQAGFCVGRKSLAELSGDLSMLHPNERCFYDGLKYDRRRESYLLGRLMAKRAITQFAGGRDCTIEIGYGIFQFPVVKHPEVRNIQVSISHCDQLGIALAFPEEHPLGIDLENILQFKREQGKEVMTAGEAELISRSLLSLAQGTALVWTVKEAMSKIIRTGLTADFSVLQIGGLIKEGLLYSSTFRYFSQYKAYSCFCGNYVCSLVLPRNTVAAADYFWQAFRDSVQNYSSDG